MSQDHSIAAFPLNINRHDFGHWLSGFSDGEGCFSLTIYKPNSKRLTPIAHFSISLRADDAPVLYLIRSYFQCGHIHFISREDQRRRGMGSKDMCTWAVTRTADNASIIIPHFDTFPLRAKKGRDYVQWREAVLFLHKCHQSPRVSSGRQGGHKWTADRVEHFKALMTALRQGRAYVAPDTLPSSAPPEPTPPPPERGLFD